MRAFTRGLAGAALAAAAGLAACAPQQTQVQRGQYLVTISGCNDCHTPGGFSPHPDAKRLLAGSDAQFEIPGMGVFVPPNLTPDKATGLGSWTRAQIVAAITTGVTPDGRILSPAMPWPDFSHLTKDDAEAVAAYLQSLPPVANKTPAPGAPKPAAADVLQAIVRRAG